MSTPSDSNTQFSPDNKYYSDDEVNSCQSRADEDEPLVDDEYLMEENGRDQDGRNTSSSDSNLQLSSDNNDSNNEVDEVYSGHFRPYENEPLVHDGEDLMEENSEENERDQDGLTPATLEARFDTKSNLTLGK